MKRHLQCLSVVAMALFATSCSDTPTPPPAGATVTAAEKKPSAQPSLNESMKSASEADRIAAITRTRIADARADAEAYRDKVLTLSGMIKKLQNEGSANATDLKALFDEVATQDAYIINLVSKLKIVEIDLDDERELRIKAEEQLAIALRNVISKEDEADTLRQQLGDSETTNAGLRKNANYNFKIAQDAYTSSAKMEGQRDLIFKILIGVLILTLISLVVNYIQFRSSRILPI